MGDSSPLWLLTDSTVLEEVATADLFRIIALDVEDVNRTDWDVVGSKLVGEEDRKKLLLVMMHQLMMPMVPQLRSMAPPLKLLVTMTMKKQVVPMILTEPQLRNMVPLLMMLMVPLPKPPVTTTTMKQVVFP